MNSVRTQFCLAQSKEKRDKARSDPDRLTYHLMPPTGWLNDPNGLCEYKGIYHIFYQYSPGRADGLSARGWGHYTTKDFIHYEEQDDPFVPDHQGDGKGSYSGSAVVDDNGLLHIFYTGNNKLEGNYDYINSGRIHWVMHSCSQDGLFFSPKEVLLKNEDYPAYLSCHVRDPKLIRKQGRWYMVLGARTRQNVGQAEVFASQDLHHWTHCSTIRTEKPFGYMWECPDLFDVDGHHLLLVCPQGLETDGIRYENIYQNGWFEVADDLDHDQYVREFKELDNGFDFYAPQTFLDDKGRRILIGWMGLPDSPYGNPTVDHGWQHALSLPRQLHYRKGRLVQFPLEEILALHDRQQKLELNGGDVFRLPGKSCHLRLHPQTDRWTMRLRKDCELQYESGILTMSLGQSGYGRTRRHLAADTIEVLDIFSDTSSLEVFVNGGEFAMTTRIYDGPEDLDLHTSSPVYGSIWSMKSFEIKERLEKKDPVTTCEIRENTDEG